MRAEATQGCHLPDGQAYARIDLGGVRPVVKTVLHVEMPVIKVSLSVLELADALWY
jgi:hypothetical protein